MVLPNFLVLGGQRCGTTLLHNILELHDEVYVPQRRKEIHYFDTHFARGPDWYRGFFPTENAASKYRAIGEVTPDYLYDPRVPQRAASLLPACRLVVVLRHPVKRAFSGYLHHVRSLGEQRSFEQFIAEQSDATERGFFSRQIAGYLELFPRDSLHVMIFEEMIDEPRRSLDALAGFLGLSRSWVDPERLMAVRVNSSERPLFATAYYHARRFGEVLTGCGLDRLVTHAKRLGLPRLFGTRREAAEMPEGCRRRLQELYRPEIAAVEELLGRRVERWR